MNDNDFNALLDKYLEGELTDPAERSSLRATLEEFPERRRQFLRVRQLKLAFSEIPTRKPSLLHFLPSVTRLRHFGSMFGNAAVFVFALGLAFPKGDNVPLETSVPTHAPATQNTRSATDSAVFAQDDFSGDFAFSADSYADTDLGSLIPVEEYGFVRL